jgi:acetyl-CoA carboxylase alpha subunit
MLEALTAAIAFKIQGERAGNVTAGRGTFGGKPVRVALVENRFSSGAIGADEAERLVALFKVAMVERAPVVVYLDSAGAKVSEGLVALGAFRALFHAALDLDAARVPMAAVLGRNCYGGSSMLAHLASRRLFEPNTRLAMSGPAILAAQAGMGALDEVFRAMAEAAMSPAARAKASPANTVLAPGGDLAGWLAEALSPAAAMPWSERHAALGKRLERATGPVQGESFHRKDLERIYDEGYEARDDHGLLEGVGKRNGATEAFVGLIGRKPVGAERAWRFADRVWAHAAKRPERLEIFLDCASHAARLEDEKVVLSEYIVDMSAAIDHVARGGTPVGLTILGQAGGGVYVALAAPVKRVTSLYEADIQVLPGAAVAAILGEGKAERAPAFEDYRAAGVADEELRLGLVS